MYSLGTTVYLAFHFFYVGVPGRIAFSIRMAYIVTKMNTLAANITLSHFATSSTLLLCSVGRTRQQHCYTNRYVPKKQVKKIFFLNFEFIVCFCGEKW